MFILTNAEARAIGETIKINAGMEGEDIIGILMKNGCFRFLPETKLVDLAVKIEIFSEIKL